MKKIILIFSLLTISVFSLDIVEPTKVKIKIKAKENNGIVKVKAAISHEMLSYDQAKKKGKKVNFITHIQAFVKENLVYDVYTSQFFSKNPFIKFKFVGKKGSKIKIIYTDLKGQSFYDIKKIK